MRRRWKLWLFSSHQILSKSMKRSKTPLKEKEKHIYIPADASNYKFPDLYEPPSTVLFLIIWIYRCFISKNLWTATRKRENSKPQLVVSCCVNVFGMNLPLAHDDYRAFFSSSSTTENFKTSFQNMKIWLKNRARSINSKWDSFFFGNFIYDLFFHKNKKKMLINENKMLDFNEK